MNELRTIMNTPWEVADAIKEIRGYVERYGWGERKVAPYGYGVKVADMLDRFKDFEEYTTMSREIMVEELNGLIRIINKWLKIEAEPKVNIKLANGKLRTVPGSVAEAYIEDGFAVLA